MKTRRWKQKRERAKNLKRMASTYDVDDTEIAEENGKIQKRKAGEMMKKGWERVKGTKEEEGS